MIGGTDGDQVGGGDTRLLLKEREDEAGDLSRKLSNPNLSTEQRMIWEARLRHLEEGIIPALRRSS